MSATPHVASGYERAAALDAADPLASWRSEFVIRDPELVYLDGNSLGMTPKRTVDVLRQLVEHEWAHDLIRSWTTNDWLDLPLTVGSELAPLLGAARNEVIVDDSTTVNLYKLATAALDRADRGSGGRRRTARPTLAVDAAEFPTDRYVAEGVAQARDGVVRHDLDDLDGVDLVIRSAVDYRTAELADIAGETRRARRMGATTLWDLSHAAGVVPLDLRRDGVEFAVGCTYKFLNGGPGAPAFAYVAAELHDVIHAPIPGWFGQVDQFAMDEPFQPRPGIARLLSGTPAVIATTAARAGISVTADAGIQAIASKASALGDLAIELANGFGFETISPRAARRRGGHVAIRHPDAAALHAALDERGVVVDKREPDVLRLGLSPLTTRFTDVARTLTVLAELTRGMLEP